MPQLTPLDIPASHGMLEALLRVPDTVSRPLAALVCHPHPQGGGTMHNKVVMAITRGLNAAGIPALRFNYRGVGRSTGTYDEGHGEGDDVRTALDWLGANYPDTPLLLAGFSFGSWVGLPIGCDDPRVTHLICVGVPFRLLHIASLSACTKPKLVVQGDQDEYGPLESLQPWFAALPEPKSLAVVRGTGHFFPEHLAEVEHHIERWVADVLS